MTCAIIGDSIAVGLAKAMPECHAAAQGGISAAEVRFTKHDADVTIISLGSNAGPDDELYLRIARANVAGAVIWMLPPSRCRDAVRRVAAQWGDKIVDVLLSDATPMHIHPSPAGYATLARLVRAAEHAGSKP